MIIGVGKGTRKLQEYLKLDKTYEAEILLGVRTDTGDVEGKILEESGSMRYEVWKAREDEVRETLSGMVGKLALPVPAYSAIKRGGEPLYKKARRGERIEPPVKVMEIKAAKLLCRGEAKPYFNKVLPYATICVRFDVGSGTYIRSLAEELGRRLNVPATLARLRRTSIGAFRVENAQKIRPEASGFGPKK